MKKHYYNAELITDGGVEYTNILDVPIIKYNNIVKASYIKLNCDDEDSNMQYSLYKFKNLHTIIFDSYNHGWDYKEELVPLISQDIANLQRLSSINFDDGSYSANLEDCKPLCFIKNNKMAIIGNCDLFAIPEHIEYLNSIYDSDSGWNNLPNTIKHLHISYGSYDEYTLKNLPISLESLSITLTGYDKETVVIDILKNDLLKYIKLPYGCVLNINVI